MDQYVSLDAGLFLLSVVDISIFGTIILKYDIPPFLQHFGIVLKLWDSFWMEITYESKISSAVLVTKTNFSESYFSHFQYMHKSFRLHTLLVKVIDQEMVFLYDDGYMQYTCCDYNLQNLKAFVIFLVTSTRVVYREILSYLL